MIINQNLVLEIVLYIFVESGYSVRAGIGQYVYADTVGVCYQKRNSYKT
jgi:hypothetical protein